MNPHFERNPDAVIQDFVPPAMAYAQIERVEPESGPGPRTFSLDAISADWLLQAAGAQNDFFNFDDPARMANSWKHYWSLAIQQLPNGKKVFRPTPSPFEKAHLYRIEIGPLQPVFVGNFNEEFWTFSPDADFEKHWYVFEFHTERVPPDAIECHLYYNAFAAPVTVHATVSFLDPASLAAIGLSTLATLDDLPTIDTNDFEDELAFAGGAEYLAAYDVGQGNANALLNPAITSNNRPTLYFDVGCGVYANRGTTPSPLSFCFNWKPLIVMSHWDSDHWMGVCLPGHPNQVAGLGLNWVAPKQNITTHHKTFALDIIAKGGSIRIYNPPALTVGTASLGPGEQIRFTRGTRAGRNHSGIVVSIEKQIAGVWNSWVLTGDCDYRYFVHLAIPNAVAVVVPHHGARPVTLNPAPLAVPANGVPGYVRAVYSFGPGNTQAGVQHPTPNAVALHLASNWSHGGVWAANPGDAMPGADTLATSEHALPHARGGCFVGWTMKPKVPVINCGCGCGSNTSLTQS